MKKKFKKRRVKKGKILKIIFLFVLVIAVIGIYLYYDTDNDIIKIIPDKDGYIASNTTSVSIYKLKQDDNDNNILEEVKEVSRGSKIVIKNKSVKYLDDTYSLIELDNKKYYILSSNITTNKDKIVQEETIYVRTSTSVIENTSTNKIVGLATKGSSLEVLSYDKINDDGSVNLYKVKLNDKEGYIYGKYISFTENEALLNYDAEKYDKIHGKIKNSYQGGEAIKLDFYPNEKPSFKDNIMPDDVYALYLNCGSDTIKNIDSYIEFAKDTKINAFVIDIKDNQTPAYPADTFKSLSPTNYSRAINSYDDYKSAIDKLKKAGFYVIGRITTFKDSYYVEDHPEDAITNKNTGKAYLHNGSYWPSAYNRNVWYYNVTLAKEAVEKFGFNEINFDYVRFPDRMNSVSNIIDLKNTYNEDKVEAIQRFVQYATDTLHELDVYVSIDVFGETTNGTYTTAYGQYWPAISNVADVISGMPYPDHFSNGYYGINKPWNNPYTLMKYWATDASLRQKECPTPAKVRTWIQAYDVMKYVDSSGISYNAKEVEEEIRGLYEYGADDGYITWLSNSSLEKYKKQKAAFQIDYGKEYDNGA